MSEKIARANVIRLKNARIKCLKIRLSKSEPFVVKNDLKDTTTNES